MVGKNTDLESGRGFERPDFTADEELIGGEGSFSAERLTAEIKFKILLGGAIGGFGNAGFLLPAEGDGGGRANRNVVVVAEEVDGERGGAGGRTEGGEGSGRSGEIVGGARAAEVEQVAGGRDSDGHFHLR